MFQHGLGEIDQGIRRAREALEKGTRGRESSSESICC